MPNPPTDAAGPRLRSGVRKAMKKAAAARLLADPPQGSPWDDALDEAPLAFLDLEMTGLDPRDDRVLEVCIERVRGDRVEDALVSLVRPEGGTFGNAHIHGIDPAEVAAAPTFADLAPRILAMLDGAILVAHAAAWDVAFLEAELARAGHPTRLVCFLDTLVLSRRAFAFPSHRLGVLCEALGIARDGAHRAAHDVAALRAVFSRAIEVLTPQTPRDLWNVRVGLKYARPDLVAAAVEAAAREATVTVRYRPSHRPPEDICFRVTGVRTDLDPPRVLGYLLPSHSHRELRADRILAIAPCLPEG
jgi:DNA polymerase-3 subunit epsilon